MVTLVGWWSFCFNHYEKAHRQVERKKSSITTIVNKNRTSQMHPLSLSTHVDNFSLKIYFHLEIFKDRPNRNKN